MSCAGVGPTAGKEILILPLKATGLTAEMSSCGSDEITPQADSSITSVNEPAASTRLLIVKLTGDGVGV